MATRFPNLFADGKKPDHPDLPGTELPFVHDAADVLARSVDLGDRIVVVGGGLVGVEVAIELAESGKQVTIVEMLPLIMKGCTATDRIAYEERLKELGVEIHVEHLLAETPRGFAVSVGATGNLLKLPADSVVMAVGCRPYNDLVAEFLQSPDPNTHNNGDCIHRGKISDVIHSGHRAVSNAQTSFGAGLKEV